MKVSAINSTKEADVSHNPNIKKHVLVSKGEINHIENFSRAVFPPGEIAHAHSHSDMTEVFFVESGQGVILVNEKPFPLKAGVCVTVEPKEMHELRNTGATNLVILYFCIKT